jgi:hypothetical protein
VVAAADAAAASLGTAWWRAAFRFCPDLNPNEGIVVGRLLQTLDKGKRAPAIPKREDRTGPDIVLLTDEDVRVGARLACLLPTTTRVITADCWSLDSQYDYVLVLSYTRALVWFVFYI